MTLRGAGPQACGGLSRPPHLPWSDPRAILKLLDTRTKIVTPEAAARAQRPVTLVLGYFDPYFAEHARTLRELRAQHANSTLIVAIHDLPGHPLLTRQARAEMLAALHAVDLVLADPTDHFEADTVVDLREKDAAWCNDLRQHVFDRSGKPRA